MAALQNSSTAALPGCKSFHVPSSLWWPPPGNSTASAFPLLRTHQKIPADEVFPPYPGGLAIRLINIHILRIRYISIVCIYNFKNCIRHRNILIRVYCICSYFHHCFPIILCVLTIDSPTPSLSQDRIRNSHPYFHYITILSYCYIFVTLCQYLSIRT